MVAYYFPPLGMSGVQRVAGFVRHLPECGWQPTVITAKPKGYFAYDESLWSSIQDAGISVIQTKSFDPTRLFRSGATVKLPAESKRKALASMSNWLFIPDNKLGWMPFAIRAGLRQAETTHFDAIFSSAPPYTGHLIGSTLSKKLKLPLIIDFRDDWIGNPRHSYPTGFHRRLHTYQERNVLLQSSAITTINRPILEGLKKRHSDIQRTGRVIPHGYDDQLYPLNKSDLSSAKLRFLYTGVFYDAQVPDYFLRGLSGFLVQNPEMRTRISAIFAGLVPDGFSELIRTLNLEGIVQYVGYKQHNEIARLHQKADILWMTIGSRAGASGISTGKLFEYMGVRKPILALVPKGTARKTLLRYGAAYLAEPECTDDVIQAFSKIIDAWLSHSFPVPDEEYVRSFGRAHLTKALSQVLDSAIERSVG